MAHLDPFLGFWRALDAAFQSVEPAWWGAVVTDSRFPSIWDVNYARIETDDPALSLAEVESALRPPLERAGARHVHLVLFHPEELAGLLAEASSRGDRLSWDEVMELRGEPPAPHGGIEVEEVRDLDDAFWEAFRGSLEAFDVSGEEARRQLTEMERAVLLPGGRRWIVVRTDGRIGALGSVMAFEDVGYVDNVVTFPQHRRRGYAGAIVTRIAREARRDGLDHLYLMTEPENPARSLYQRLGFVTVGRLASTLRPAPAGDG